MDPVVATSSGILVAIFVAVWSKIATGKGLQPALFFLAALTIHSTIDPILRVSQGLSVPEDVMGIVMFYNMMCIISFAFGVIVTTMLVPFRFSSFSPVSSMMNRDSLQYLLIFTTIISVISLGLLAISGVIFEARGAFRSERTASFNMAKDILTFATFSSVFLISNQILSQNEIKFRRILLVGSPAILVLISDFATFGRQNSLIIFTTLAIVLICRVGQVKAKYYISGIAVFLAIAVFGMFRRLRIGIFDISTDAIYSAYVSGRLTFEELFFFVFTTISGQEIFINVVRAFNTERIWYGSTYLWNMVSRLTFGSAVPDNYQTAQAWYRDTFLSADTYGRDFGMIAESYLNFGQSGFLVFVFVGAIIAILSRITLKSQNTLLVCWAAYMIVNLIVGLRNDSYPVFSRTIFSILPVWLFLMFLREPAVIFANRRRAR